VLSILLILLLILFANTGLRLMEDVNDGGIPSVFLLQLLGLKLIQYFSLLIPISLFFGIIIALNKLHVSNEMVIMKLNGYSNKLISVILTRIIVITAIIVMLFNCFITPHTVDIRSEIEHQIVHEQKIYSLRDKNFTISNDGSKVIYVNNKNKLTIANVFIKSITNESNSISISSGISTTETNEDIIKLVEGKSYVFNPDGSFSSTKYLNQDILLSNEVPKSINNDLESKSILELFQLNDVLSFSEILKRFSMIIATLILGFLAIPLSHINAREDKYRNIFIAAFFYFSYVVLINIFAQSFDTKVYILLSLISLHIIYLYITYKLFTYTNYTRQ
jgi:lipopolysaccharide export system permease protein